jgi:endonuclease/exonuclease/phosphatase family metal-dependent hydrolase
VWDPHVRLDYVFGSAGHAERLLTCEVVREPPASEASDHFPLFTEIAVESDGSEDPPLQIRGPAL